MVEGEAACAASPLFVEESHQVDLEINSAAQAESSASSEGLGGLPYLIRAPYRPRS
jgi:hypothetical protein